MKKKLIIAAVLIAPVALTAALLAFLFGPSHTWPPHNWSPEEYGSFSPDITYSYDEKYRAVQTLVKPKGAKVDFIEVRIYENESGEEAAAFLTERAFDFWGVCWENDSYNLWIQSGDIGTYCMEYEDGTWVRPEDSRLELPEGIINRFRMQNGSFSYVSAFSPDGRCVADRNSFDDCVDVCDAATGSLVFRWPIDQIKDFRGVCWDRSGNLWLRSGNEAFALRSDGESWVYDPSLPKPEEVVFAYKWDGSPA